MASETDVSEVWRNLEGAMDLKRQCTCDCTPQSWQTWRNYLTEKWFRTLYINEKRSGRPGDWVQSQSLCSPAPKVPPVEVFANFLCSGKVASNYSHECTHFGTNWKSYARVKVRDCDLLPSWTSPKTWHQMSTLSQVCWRGSWNRCVCDVFCRWHCLPKMSGELQCILWVKWGNLEQSQATTNAHLSSLAAESKIRWDYINELLLKMCHLGQIVFLYPGYAVFCNH